jgi:hypothetical protein
MASRIATHDDSLASAAGEFCRHHCNQSGNSTPSEKSSASNDHVTAVGTIHGDARDDSIIITGAPTAGAGTANVYGDDGNDASCSALPPRPTS